MKDLDHIAALRAHLEAEQELMDDFADDHQNEGWLEYPWSRLRAAYDDGDRERALDELEAQYQRLKFLQEFQ